jgi:hypothetical protein
MLADTAAEVAMNRRRVNGFLCIAFSPFIALNSLNRAGFTLQSPRWLSDEVTKSEAILLKSTAAFRGVASESA